MKSKSLLPIILVCAFAGVLAFIISSSIFKSASHTEKAPNIQVIDSSLPDVKHESSYNSVFYPGALDPTQTVQIGNSNNNTPF